MLYNLKKDKTIKNLTYFSYHFEGLTINTKKHKRKNMINVNKMVLTDEKIINNYINKKLDKKFKKLLELIYQMLSTPGESDSDITNFLSEINRLKSIIDNKYKYYLNVLEYDRFMKKLFLIETELKRKLIEIEMNKYYYDIETQEITEEKTR